jgi:hypothetical protein
MAYQQTFQRNLFENDDRGYSLAVEFLKSIGQYNFDEDDGVTVIIEANRIKAAQQYLTE